jgi:hypothetical protein
MKKIIWGMVVLSVVVIGTLILLNSRDSDVVKLKNIYKIPEIKALSTPIFSKTGEEIYFQTDSGITKYTFASRKVEIISEIKDDFIFELVEDKILVCRWENFNIDDPQDIATKIWIEDLEGHIFAEFESSKTIRPETCDKSKITAIDNYPNSPERYYHVDLEKSLVDEITKPLVKKQIFTEDGDFTTFTVNDIKYLVEYPNVFIEAGYGSGKVVLISKDREVWVGY